MQKQRIDQGWTFWKDSHEAAIRNVTLPHDAMILETQDPKLENGAASGFYPGSKYVYTKKLFGSDELCDGAAIVEFEGVYMDAHVFLNGEDVGGRIYGYSNFFVDLTGRLKRGEDNELKVIADNSKTPNSRWYSGSGIYRHVNLWTGPADAILPESVRISTVSIAPAVIRITAPKPVKVTVAGISGEGTDFTLTIPHAKLWSAESPNLYTAHVSSGSDSEDIRFGIRTLSWDSKKGFQVNGETVKLRGGCVHHDHGILGAASYDKAEYRRAKKLKEMGYNAIRYSHNPAGKNFLDVCDELGLYVIDEAFDQWKVPQTAHDYATVFDAEWQKDIASMVSKDYNHPCVIMYGIGNEITDTGLSFGAQLCKAINAYTKSLDDTRPTMVAFNSMLCTMAHMKEQQSADGDGGNVTSKDANDVVTLLAKIMASITPESLEAIIGECADTVDIVGYNYGHNLYAGTHEAHPDRVILSSETFPCRMDSNWKAVMENDYVIGDFHWTAWDYLGEAGVGQPTYGTTHAPFSKDYPCRLAACGSFDLTGFPETAAHYSAILWGAEKGPRIAVRPVDHSGEEYTLGRWRLTDSIESWTWPGCEGRDAEIEVYAAGDSVELKQDSVSVGKKPLVDCEALFKIPYCPGKLTAISYAGDGTEIARSELATAGDKVELRILPESETLKADGEDIAYMAIHVTDEAGTLNMSANRRIHIAVEGAAELLAIGSADPESTERYDADSFLSYHGRAIAVIRSNGRKGAVLIRAYAEGVTSAEIEIRAV